MAGIDRFAGSGASLEQLGELEEIRVGVAPPEFELPVGVILAAGKGSRLGVGSKALARLAGITLLERAVITLRAVGIEEILVVVGHEKERLREFVRERGLGVQLVENGDFGLGNGSSACVGARAAGGRFLLAMVDHVVDPEALRRLLRSEAAFALAVDSRPQLNDVDEATKVRLQEGRVLAVRRELDVWEAVDAGLALCDAEVTDVAERSLAAGEQSWNAVKRRWLGEGGEIEAVDLEGLFWIDVDTPADRRRAERTLVSLAARKPLDGPVSRLVNRRLSWPISLVLLRAGVSPGAATVATFLFALAAAAVLALGVAWPVALVLGGLLVQLASILDGVDGEIARASLRSSPFGGFLDSVLDRAADAAVLAALAVAAGLDATTWALLAAALFGSLMTPYVKAAYEAAYRRPLPRPISPINAGRDVRLLVASLSAVALQPFWGLVALAILTNAEAVQRFVGAARTRWTDASAIPVRAESE